MCHRRKYSPQIIDSIRKYADIYPSNRELSKVVGVNEKVLSDLMYRNRITRSNNGSKGRVASINHDAFSKPNPNSDYWAGFIAADGCVMGDCLYINLQISDIDHLVKFYTFVGSNLKPRVSANGVYCRAAIKSSKITECLRNIYGITPQKSNSYSPVRITKDFIRGYFDGDGSLTVGSKQHGRASICGTRECISALSDNIPFKMSIYERPSGLNISLMGESTSIAFMLWIYSGGGDILDRKADSLIRVIRMLSDIKIKNVHKRVASFAENGELQVKDESVLDSLQDLANYSCLLAGYIKSKSTDGIK